MTAEAQTFTARCAGRASLKGIHEEPFHIVTGDKTLCGRDASDWMRMDAFEPTDDPREMALHRDCCRSCRKRA